MKKVEPTKLLKYANKKFKFNIRDKKLVVKMVKAHLKYL